MNNRITADDVLRKKLGDLAVPLEVCDDSGKALGHYLPAETYRALLYSSANEPQISSEELQARFAEPGGRKLADILRDLQSK
jgi:hypothetical protein